MAKILIIEDDKLLLKVYRTNFDIMGFEVDTAADGQEGWEKIKLGGYDVILLDLKLPKLSGMQLLTLVKNENMGHKNGAIVVLSNVDDRETVMQIKQLGAAGYLIKDRVSPQSVVAEVSKYLTSKIPKEARTISQK